MGPLDISWISEDAEAIDPRSASGMTIEVMDGNQLVSVHKRPSWPSMGRNRKNAVSLFLTQQRLTVIVVPASPFTGVSTRLYRRVLRHAEKNDHPVLLVIYPSFGVTARLAYTYMRPSQCLESEANSGAILDDYFFPRA